MLLKESNQQQGGAMGRNVAEYWVYVKKSVAVLHFKNDLLF